MTEESVTYLFVGPLLRRSKVIQKDSGNPDGNKAKPPYILKSSRRRLRRKGEGIEK